MSSAPKSFFSWMDSSPRHPQKKITGGREEKASSKPSTPTKGVFIHRRTTPFQHIFAVGPATVKTELAAEGNRGQSAGGDEAFDVFCWLFDSLVHGTLTIITGILTFIPDPKAPAPLLNRGYFLLLFF